MSLGPLRLERPAEGVALLTLDLPDRRNAMTVELTDAWVDAVRRLRADPQVRCVVVTAVGSTFCSGGDLDWIGESAQRPVPELRDRMLAFYRSWLSIRDLEVPVLAAVNGPAIGAGLCLALACDLRYAGERASFAATFTALGMHPGMAASWLLPQAIGLPRTRELLFTGRTVGAVEAAQIGLIHGVFPDDLLRDEVLAVAATVAAQAPLAVRLTKAALAGGSHPGLEDALAWEALAQAITMATDLGEGLRARAERRPARFSGT